jgi:type IV pilus assembly protein PilF
MTLTTLLRRAPQASPLALALVAGCASAPTQQDDTGGATLEPQAANVLAEVQTKLGIGYLREGKLDLAYNRLSKAIEADPDYSTAHNAMGTLQERLGDLARAEEQFQTAVRLNPSDSSAQSNYGSLLCRTGRYEEGEQRFLQALKNSLYERPEVAYANAGLCMMAAGNPEKAETYFRAALQRNPRMAAALEAMAQISFETQRYLPARAYLQRFGEVSEFGPAQLWLGVRIERELGDKAAANRYARKLRENFPDSNETRELDNSK